mmetsp:Transcript_23451/g.39077  ORF Transcript_23451/g.39077 Transcript_23451/m.39077 type:complete len:803 (-) Transcript_23451:521-2929(-)
MRLLGFLFAVLFGHVLCVKRVRAVRRIVQATLNNAIEKIEKNLDRQDRGTPAVALDRRFLVVYHIGNLGLKSNSLDIAVNNLHLFLSALKSHGKDDHFKAFYVFNVVDGITNPLLHFLPTSDENVALMRWTVASSDLDTHLRSVQMLGEDVIKRFGTVLFMNQGVRGPVVKRQNGEWLGEFARLMNSNNVALVGPTMSCEVSPHVQTHMFALRTSIVPHILSDMRKKLTKKFRNWQRLIVALEVGLTGVVQRAGYNVSSFLYEHRGHPYFQEGQCLKYWGPPNQFDKNPTGWCGVTPQELVFIKWGGEPMRTPGFMCNTTLWAMEDLMEKIATDEPETPLRLPEAMMGGALYPLYGEYNREVWRDRHPIAPTRAGKSSPKVCFLVRTTTIAAESVLENPNSKARLLNKDIELLITTLRRQTNPNWKAFFFLIDTVVKEKQVRTMLDKFDDPRLGYVALPETLQRAFEHADAGYLASDYVLQNILSQHQDECKWLSLTTGDNSYGSEVVGRILDVAPTETSQAPDMVIAPMDSRRFMDQDLFFRKKFMRNHNFKLDEYCALLSNIEHNTFTYAVRPVPIPGKIDVSSAFFSSAKLSAEHLYFSNFSNTAEYPCMYNLTDPLGYNCLHNQGGHFIYHLAQNRLWSYTRLPIDGLKSVVFHGASPTQCIGGGNAWVDHFDRGQQRCITHKDLLKLQNTVPASEHQMDILHFYSQNEILGTCLRVRTGLHSIQNRARHAVNEYRHTVYDYRKVLYAIACLPIIGFLCYCCRFSSVRKLPPVQCMSLITLSMVLYLLTTFVVLNFAT